MKEDINNLFIKKNDEFIVDIVDYGTNGQGIAKIDGYTIFVNGALKGEKCKIHILKALKDYGFAKIEKVIEQSEFRKDSDCLTYSRCGGCVLRHISYDETLKIKQNQVQNLVRKTLKSNPTVNTTIGMENPFYYRNKAIYPISKDKKVGLYAERTHDVIPLVECKIQTAKSQKIASFILDNWKDSIYDEATNKGLLRNIIIREGFSTQEVMVILVQNGEKWYDPEKLLKQFPEITSIVININTSKTNVILGNKNIVIYGKGYIQDKLGDYTFKISPNSFYQINPTQTKKLYDIAINMTKLEKEDILFDLYCGTGTIGIFAAKYVKKVYGIEIVPEAIEDAKENARINNVQNAEFIVGDVETAFDKLINQNKINLTALIVDPPRKGLDENTIYNILKTRPDKLTYISCNPATLMRDLAKLEEKYNIKQIQPVDMFPFTKHIECVTVLYLK